MILKTSDSLSDSLLLSRLSLPISLCSLFYGSPFFPDTPLEPPGSISTSSYCICPSVRPSTHPSASRRAEDLSAPPPDRAAPRSEMCSDCRQPFGTMRQRLQSESTSSPSYLGHARPPASDGWLALLSLLNTIHTNTHWRERPPPPSLLTAD